MVKASTLGPMDAFTKEVGIKENVRAMAKSYTQMAVLTRVTSRTTLKMDMALSPSLMVVSIKVNGKTT